MIIINKKFDGIAYSYDDYTIEKQVYFDIETTGFVADKSFLYLIGCCYYQDNTWNLIQWFCESPTDEFDVLQQFIQFLEPFEVCIHYNGTTFDIPYITRKCKKFNLDFSFQNIKSIDLYKCAQTLKSLLHLDSCTQKAVEQALSISRDDQFTGGELIQVYANYLGLAKLEKLQREKNNSGELLHLLLLHNEDDLIGLQAITSILSYQKLIHGCYDVSNLNLDTQNRICFELNLQHALPVPFLFQEANISIEGKNNDCVIKVPLFEGTLKYYVDDYTNYYYLPLEDSIVHKSIAGAMDKDYRLRATKDNCYIKKTALFLPQFQSDWTPVFRLERKDKNAYLECTDERLQDSEFIQEYTNHILTTLLSSKVRKARKVSSS